MEAVYANARKAVSALRHHKFALIGACLIGAGCGVTASTANRKNQESKPSSDSTLLVALPSIDQYTAAQKLQLTGYHLTVTPGAECTTAETVDVVGPWSSNISRDLSAGCSYIVGIQLGLLQGSDKLVKPLFTNQAAGKNGQVFKIAADASGKTFALNPRLYLTDAGRNAGFAEELASDKSESSGESTPDETLPPVTPLEESQPESNPPPVAPLPAPTPAPANPSVKLTVEQDVTLTAPDGSTQKLSQFFTTKYLLVVVAQSGCGACIGQSTQHESDSAFKTTMQGSNCRLLTALSNQDLATWMKRFPQSTFIGGSSFGIGKSIGSFMMTYNVPVAGTPTYFVLDQTGKTVTYRIGGVPPQVSSLCSGS